MVNKFKALSDVSRLRLINIIMVAELCLCEIEVILDMSQSNVSRHISKLKSAGIVDSYKVAQWTHFKLSRDFKVAHKYLFEYLKVEFSQNPDFIRDLERFHKYKSNGLNCTLIREDRDNVMKIIL